MGMAAVGTAAALFAAIALLTANQPSGVAASRAAGVLEPIAAVEILKERMHTEAPSEEPPPSMAGGNDETGARDGDADEPRDALPKEGEGAPLRRMADVLVDVKGFPPESVTVCKCQPMDQCSQQPPPNAQKCKSDQEWCC